MIRHALAEFDFLVWRTRGRLRRWWKKAVAPFFVLVLALPLGAQDVQQTSYVGVLTYDLDSASTIYCKGGEGYIQANTGNIITSGSSTTVTNAGTSETPFSLIAAGDVIIANGLSRFVSAKASDTSITVDSAINLDRTGGFPWFYIHFVCGTGAEDGWMPMAKYGRGVIVVFELNQSNTTSGTGVIWQCRASAPGAQPVQIFPPSGFKSYLNAVAADPATGRTAVVVNEPWHQCRVGMKLDTTDDGGDTGANAEQINVYVLGRK